MPFSRVVTAPPAQPATKVATNAKPEIEIEIDFTVFFMVSASLQV
jgi:hypothetical protein